MEDALLGNKVPDRGPAAELANALRSEGRRKRERGVLRTRAKYEKNKQIRFLKDLDRVCELFLLWFEIAIAAVMRNAGLD